MNKHTDWLARTLGVLGFALALTSLSWQVFTYHDSIAERVVVTNISRWHVWKQGANVDDLIRRGDLTVEIVNVGQRPIYIRDVALSINQEGWNFHLDKGQVSPLVPGDVANYRIQNWDFDTHPLDWEDDSSQRKNYAVTVSSNKGEILRYSGPISIELYSGPRLPRPSRAP